jgi:hypothetical protein
VVEYGIKISALTFILHALRKAARTIKVVLAAPRTAVKG